jgi:ubiquinone/menaquinone biosynthesis C-methylase UbiE
MTGFAASVQFLNELPNRHATISTLIRFAFDRKPGGSPLDRSAIFMALRVAAALAAAVYFGRQVKKPTRFVGRLFARLMNTSHAPLTDWALTHLEIGEDATVLDVGCGGGRTIEKLAAKAAKVYGIDYAAGSVAESRAHNQRLIAQGRVFVERASVSQLPFAGNFFDVVTAIETQYYWPEVEAGMREILRVLKPGGRLMVVAESYRGARNDWLLGPVMHLLGSNRLGVDDHRGLFQRAGYTAVEVIEERSKGWLCAIGQKPL